MKTKKIKKDKVNVITLGCSKNLADSEVLMGQLSANGIDVSHESSEPANIVVINTCGFIDLAKQESIDTIVQYADIKSNGGIEKLYVTGCLSQRYKDDLEKEIPEVDAYFGTMELPGLLSRLNADYKHELVGEKLLTTPGHYVYMKISEGCNRTCSFCAIPLMRGKHISKPVETLVKEAKNMARIGVKELILIAQELTYYGLDLYKKRMLPELLEALSEVEGIEWIRLHYAYPNKFPMEILEAMAKYPKVCNYLDIPLQHASDSVLERMKRQTTREEQKKLIERAREMVPGICIRTTFLVGFPGENEDEFNELCTFVEEMQFERVGVFQYSHEEDTSAYILEDDVSAEVKSQRSAKIMEIQRDISFAKNQLLVGRKLKVLIDRKEGDYFIGRTEYDSPEVDNEVLIEAASNYFRIGDFVFVEITAAEDYDLYAIVIKD
ncbi:MAG: 30S ribosomal protein S12 methylthiotransferase RimO [Saprospiraceae bacterium]|nr:30S ribosomal protein S12 methylthiotransferase RimO [Saprospiraceae bacterium]MBK7524180.1 30S ribosomal protein S12 methylthiotransferase RimO [Saprospiraceae bacterium]MBK8855614.1 30S ribosomal protein S12 methylthiotransferase RimO [Saprospiraceae bacterium]MBK9043536.1 30S ribosomal protein S12 methylthiotransferase RimO [Saprospiraceae bacterium]